ncbi:hypothetical protein OG338_25615 [Streptomyces sp. NBC_00726]|uniref:orotate phosphoribosyltransferase n=1 Tax=Streptomyces sp. NBC_00726 TaxID=2903674 RepID=UPI0038693C52
MTSAALAQALLDRAPFVTAHRSDGLLLSDYFDGHRVLGEPALLHALALALHERIAATTAEVVAGEVAAGGQLATAVSLVSASTPRPLEARAVRRTAKDYGLSGRLSSRVPEGTRFAVVDDVAGTGAALERTVLELRRQQHPVVGAFVILDRQQGAAEALERIDCPLTALFRLEDLTLLRRPDRAPESATSKRTGT